MISGLLSGGYLAGVFLAVVATMVRVGGFVWGIPPLSGPAAPTRVRAALLAHIALALCAAQGFPTIDPRQGALALGGIFAAEVGLGLALGLMVRVVFAGAEAFGHIASYSLGLGFATQVDPSTGESSTVLARLGMLVAGMVMFVTDAHLPLLGVALETFRAWPPGHAPSVVGGGLALAQSGALVFELGLRLAAPIVAIGLMIYLVLAVITKVSPQLNLFAIGFAMLIPAGLLVLVAEVPDLVAALIAQLEALPMRLELLLARGA